MKTKKVGKTIITIIWIVLVIVIGVSLFSYIAKSKDAEDPSLKDEEFTVSFRLTNVTARKDNPNKVEKDKETAFNFTARQGYRLPDTVSVTGAEHIWDKASGVLTVKSITQDVVVTIVGIFDGSSAIDSSTDDVSSSEEPPDSSNPPSSSQEPNSSQEPVATVPIELDYDSCVVEVPGNPTEVAKYGSVTLYFQPAENCELCDHVSVDGADYEWDIKTGVLTLFDITGEYIYVSLEGHELIRVEGTVNIVYVYDELMVSIGNGDNYLADYAATSMDAGARVNTIVAWYKMGTVTVEVDGASYEWVATPEEGNDNPVYTLTLYEPTKYTITVTLTYTKK